ncbi:MAG: (2Fe-2S)-binding protein [Chloroflexota bacterium]
MKLKINEKEYDVPDSPSRVLLWTLRDELGLIGTKFGCGVGICGSCTVHINGVAVRSCITPLSDVDGAITTIEGLASQQEDGSVTLHPVQQAFLDNQVPQCSWCMSGQMMTAVSFLNENSTPSEEEIVDAMSNNYCRCGCYYRIKTAVADAATLITAQGKEAA